MMIDANYIIDCGLVVFKIVEGDFARTGQCVEFLMDDMLYASFRTPKVRSKHTTFNTSEYGSCPLGSEGRGMSVPSAR